MPLYNRQFIEELNGLSIETVAVKLGLKVMKHRSLCPKCRDFSFSANNIRVLHLYMSFMCCKNTNFILNPTILCLKISEKAKSFLIFADF